MSYINRKMNLFKECGYIESPYGSCYTYNFTIDGGDWCHAKNHHIPITPSINTTSKKVFTEYGRTTVEKKHSNGRMKSYQSASYISWSNNKEERMKHILELVRQEYEDSFGKYIPIKAIINILLANNNRLIEQLKNEINNLQKILESHGLKYDDQPKIHTKINELMVKKDSKYDNQDKPIMPKGSKSRREKRDVTGNLEKEIESLKEEASKINEGGDSIESNRLLAELEKERNSLKYNSKDIEALKEENSSLKTRIEDLIKIQKDYEKLLKKRQDSGTFQGNCIKCTDFENVCNDLKCQFRRVAKIEKEKEVLIKKNEENETCIKNQKNEIEKLTKHIESLTKELDKLRQPVESQPPNEKFLPTMLCYGGMRPTTMITRQKMGICSCCGQHQSVQQHETLLIRPPDDIRILTHNKKIVELKGNVCLKDNCSKQTVKNLQNDIDKFKRDLELEKLKNSTLFNRYANQCEIVANIKNEINQVKEKHHKDTKSLQHLNTTLKDILERSSRTVQSCVCRRKNIKMLTALDPRREPSYQIPQFHSDISFGSSEDESYRHHCIMNRETFPYQAHSFDSFRIHE